MVQDTQMSLPRGTEIAMLYLGLEFKGVYVTFCSLIGIRKSFINIYIWDKELKLLEYQ